MDTNIYEAQEIIRQAITYAVNKRAQGILARASFYLGERLWG